MIVKQLIEVFDILDSADASGLKVKEYLESKGATNVEVVKREKDGKSTDFVKVVIPGSNGRLKGGNAPSLGIIGRLGGIGARPERIGFVSDGDGALTALAAAAKILDMNSKKDFLPGDVFYYRLLRLPCGASPVQVPTLSLFLQVKANYNYLIFVLFHSLVRQDRYRPFLA